ncbi:MAG: hypothetical protein M3332_12445 [Actinomycetota bacterium]|nr:hypothetical protein [Actinomycetota bacterium]
MAKCFMAGVPFNVRFNFVCDRGGDPTNDRRGTQRGDGSHRERDGYQGVEVINDDAVHGVAGMSGRCSMNTDWCSASIPSPIVYITNAGCRIRRTCVKHKRQASLHSLSDAAST